MMVIGKLAYVMNKTTTKIRALTFTILIEEVDHRDMKGGIICYIASVYKQSDHDGSMQLLRRSRLPGAAVAMQRAIQRDGIQAFDHIAKGTL